MNAPALAPLEKKQRLVESYAKSYRDIGQPMTTEAVEALVVSDLELVDAADRAGELRGGQAAPDNADKRAPSDPVQDAAREAGLTLNPQGNKVAFGETDSNPQFTSERWALAGGRISRILEGAGGSSNVREAVKNAAHPALATEYIETWWFFMTRDRIAIVGRNDHNPFRGLNDRDAVRMLVRRVEDICDKSTGKFGPWYVN